MDGGSLNRRWFHRHPILAKLAFALFGCFVAIFCTEIMGRMFFPQWAPAREERVKFWTYSPVLGWEHVPNQRGVFNHQDFSVEVATNSFGMRDDEYSLERTSKKRMLVVGDSYGWGFGVEHQERFSEILESRHPDWEIINASVSGYGTDQQLLYLKEKGVEFQPDVVLLLFYKNDFKGNVLAEENWHFKPFYSVENGTLQLQNSPVPKASIQQRFDRFFLGKTFLGHKLYISFLQFESRVKSQRRAAEGGLDTGTSTGDPAMYDVTGHLVTAMNDLSEKEDFQLVFVSIPMNAEHRAMLHAMTEKEDIPLLQLDEYFESTEGRKKFPHDSHWNAYGHAVAADAIDGFLGEINLFSSANTER